MSETILLSGRHVELRPMGSPELSQAIDLILSCDSFTWRGVGPGAPRSAIARLLDEGVLSQFLLTDKEHGRPVGLVQAISPNFLHGTAHLTLAIPPPFQGAAWPMEGLILFTHYLFVGYPLRYLLAELPDHNVTGIGNGLSRVMSLDGTRPSSEWHSGTHRDVYLYSLSRQQFYENEIVTRLLDQAVQCT